MFLVSADAREFEKTMNKMQKNLGKISRTVTSVGKGMTTAFTVPLAAIGAFAVKTGMDFESAFAGVRKTVDTTEEGYARLADGIREMAQTLPTSAVEIARVAEAAGQLGIEEENILSFSRVMIDLGETTNMAADQAAVSLARLANITQMPEENFDRLGATVVALGNNLATTEGEIVEMGLRLAGAGSQVGMTEAQILSLAGALSSVGVEAQMGGSAFSRVMVDMQLAVKKGGKDLENFAAVAGVKASEFADAWETDAAGAILMFVQGLSTAEERGLSAIEVLDDMGITEIRLRDALLRAAGASDVFSEAMEIGNQAWSENSALTKEAEERYKTTASQLEILRNKLTEAGITLYESLGPILRDTVIPAVTSLVEKIQAAVDWFGALSPQTQMNIVRFAALLAALGPVLIVLGTLIGAVGNIIPLFTSLGKFVLPLVGKAVAVLTGAMGPWVLAIGAVIAIGVLLWRNWDTIKAAAQNMVSSVRASFDSFKASVLARISAVRTSVANLKTSIVNTLKGINLFSIGRAIVDGLVNGIKNGASSLANAIRDIASNAVTAGKNFLGIRSPSTVFAGIGENMGEGMEQGIRQASSLVSDATRDMAENASGSVDVSGRLSGAGAVLRVIHKVDLVNVPSSVDKDSLTARLEAMLNNPAVRRKLDQIAYKNLQGKLGGAVV